MMPRLAGVALILCFASPAYAQELTPLDIAFQVCIAPGFIPDGDPYELVASLPENYCIKACKAAAKGCKAVVKTIDKCGVSFLKASVKTGTAICQGLGGTSRECRAVKDIIAPDIDWWKAQGKIEQAFCDVERDALCLSRCG